MLHVDGRQGEGGGQVLRTCLSLSALTGRAVRVEHIRAGRSRPGLRPQHLTAARALAEICGATLEGDKIDSQTLTFSPMHPPSGGAYVFDVCDAAQNFSAGAVTLIWQALLWPLCFADGPSQITLRGGTFVPFSPPYHYMAQVAATAFSRLGVSMTAKLNAWGWMARGLGEVSFQLQPLSQLNAMKWPGFQRPVEKIVRGVAAVSNLPAHISQRMANRAINSLRQAGIAAQIDVVRDKGAGSGAGICLWLSPDSTRHGGFSALGRKGLPADRVADQAVAQLMAFMENGAAVDPCLADQLLLPMALGIGTSQFTTNHLTSHTQTQAALLRQWLEVRIEIDGALGQPATITISGVGFKRASTGRYTG